MENFKENKLAVNCKTQNEADQLMEILSNNKIKWESGESVLKNSKWYYHGDQTYYAFCETGLVFAELPALFERTTISFQEFADGNRSLKEKVLEIIGVKVGEKFNISGSSYNPFYFDEDYEMRDCDGDRCTIKVIDILWRNSKIEKLPEDPNVEVKKYIELLSTTTPLTKNIREGILVSLKEILDLKESKSA